MRNQQGGARDETQLKMNLFVEQEIIDVFRGIQCHITLMHQGSPDMITFLENFETLLRQYLSNFFEQRHIKCLMKG